MSLESDMYADMIKLRREAMIRRVLDALRQTIQLQGMTPDTPVEDVRAYMTEDSVKVIAPFVEAFEILCEISYISDRWCRGHRDCAHSLEPWEQARALIRRAREGPDAE
jgi:hypothetical protein